MNTNQDQKHEIDLLRRQVDTLSEAAREAIEALDQAESVQGQLVAALKAISELSDAEVADNQAQRLARAALAAVWKTT